MKAIHQLCNAPLLLASSSPRRLEMLRSLGLSIIPSPANVDESVFDNLAIHERVMALAELKARDGSRRAPLPPHFALGADTLIVIDNRVIGKPSNAAEATTMLGLLSGKTHLVLSGVCLLDRHTGKADTAVSETRVTFAKLSIEEIEWYVSTGEWEGAAGAYKIQEKAALFVDRIDGSYSGVVGLPLHLFYAMISAIEDRL